MFVALALLQLLAFVPAVRRMRRPDPSVRTDGRMDLLDAAASLTFLAAIALGNDPLLLVGGASLGVVIAVKGYRTLRMRREA